jgi:hypothetical protein
VVRCACLGNLRIVFPLVFPLVFPPVGSQRHLLSTALAGWQGLVHDDAWAPPVALRSTRFPALLTHLAGRGDPRRVSPNLPVPGEQAAVKAHGL